MSTTSTIAADALPPDSADSTLEAVRRLEAAAIERLGALIASTNESIALRACIGVLSWARRAGRDAARPDPSPRPLARRPADAPRSADTPPDRDPGTPAPIVPPGSDAGARRHAPSPDPAPIDPSLQARIAERDAQRRLAARALKLSLDDRASPRLAGHAGPRARPP